MNLGQLSPKSLWIETDCWLVGILWWFTFTQFGLKLHLENQTFREASELRMNIHKLSVFARWEWGMIAMMTMMTITTVMGMMIVMMMMVKPMVKGWLVARGADRRSVHCYSQIQLQCTPVHVECNVQCTAQCRICTVALLYITVRCSLLCTGVLFTMHCLLFAVSSIYFVACSVNGEICSLCSVDFQCSGCILGECTWKRRSLFGEICASSQLAPARQMPK